MPWTSPPVDPDHDVLVGADRPMLESYLGWHRATFLNICSGLSAQQLAERPIASSQLSLLGLIRHLAKVERIWLRDRVAGEQLEPLYGGAGDLTDFTELDPARAADEVEQLRRESQLGDAAVAGLPFEHPLQVHGEAWSLRMVYVHLIGEYARHNGHADLLREAVDGVTAR